MFAPRELGAGIHMRLARENYLVIKLTQISRDGLHPRANGVVVKEAAITNRIETRVEHRATRRTNSLTSVGAVKDQGLLRKRQRSGRRHLGIPVNGVVRETLIIREEEDDIRPCATQVIFSGQGALVQNASKPAGKKNDVFKK